MQTLTLDQLRSADSPSVTVKAEGGSFIVQIATRTGDRAILAKARSTAPRYFGTPVQAMAALRTIGILMGSFDVSGWTPKKVASRSRPDRSAALKGIHEAAAYDRWFNEQVTVAIVEADDPSTKWISHTDAVTAMSLQREALKSRLAKV